jgi:hypothetical protein
MIEWVPQHYYDTLTYARLFTGIILIVISVSAVAWWRLDR